MGITRVRGRVLIVAGSDSGGGAGIQGDIKTVTALGGYASTAITAMTAQNSRGVFGIVEVPPEFIVQQMRLVLDDIGADCIKIGMLHRVEVINAVCDVLETEAADIPVVVDPVMIAKGGHALLVDDAVHVLRTRLVPLARVLTPNRPEADALAGGDAATADERAARLLALGPAAVLLKGGHDPGSTVRDVLWERGGISATVFEDSRIDTRHTHGTGCALASAIATSIAQGLAVREAVARARAYVRDAIRTAPGFGGGHGPLNHGHTVRSYSPPSD